MPKKAPVLVLSALISMGFTSSVAARTPEAPPRANERELMIDAERRGIEDPQIFVVQIENTTIALVLTGAIDDDSSEASDEVLRRLSGRLGYVVVTSSSENARAAREEIWPLQVRGSTEAPSLVLHRPGAPLQVSLESPSPADSIHLRDKPCRFFCKLGKALGDILIRVLAEQAERLLTEMLQGIQFRQEVDDTTPGTWTAWLNRDRPGGAGDFEALSSFVERGEACSRPRGIECRVRGGADWTETGQIYTCEPSQGGICRNTDQAGGGCLDYEVRFLCP